MTNRVTKQWLLSKIKVSESGCWEWQGPINELGYGRIRHRGRKKMVHRMSHLLFNGKLKKGQLVLHHCDNPGCINPGHLYAGSNQDNMRDRTYRNRTHRHTGETNGRSKLTESDVVAIRKSNLSQSKIAEQFNVTKGLVGQIRRRTIWKHVA